MFINNIKISIYDSETLYRDFLNIKFSLSENLDV